MSVWKRQKKEMSDLSVKLTCNLSHFASYDTYFAIHNRPRANIVNMAPNTGWSKSVFAPDDYNTYIRCTETFRSPCISSDTHEMLCWWDPVRALAFTLLPCRILTAQVSPHCTLTTLNPKINVRLRMQLPKSTISK